MKTSIASPLAAALAAVLLAAGTGARAADADANSAVQALQSDRMIVAQAAAQENNPEGSGMAKSRPAQLGKADRAFVTKAAGGGLYEVEVSKLAESRASDPAVKQFAAMLVKDHTAANEELKQFAAAHNYPLPSVPPKDKQAAIDRLAKLSGARFDTAYREEVGLKDHKEDIKLFERASRATGNQLLKAWVDKTLPTLREHLKHAEELKVGQAG